MKIITKDGHKGRCPCCKSVFQYLISEGKWSDLSHCDSKAFKLECPVCEYNIPISKLRKTQWDTLWLIAQAVSATATGALGVLVLAQMITGSLF